MSDHSSKLDLLRDIMGSPPQEVVCLLVHHTPQPSAIRTAIFEAAGFSDVGNDPSQALTSLEALGLRRMDDSGAQSALEAYKGWVKARQKNRPDHHTPDGRQDGFTRMGHVVNKLVAYFGHALNDTGVHALANAWAQEDKYTLQHVHRLWPSAACDLSGAACVVRWAFAAALGWLAVIPSSANGMSFTVANQLPVELAVWDAMYQHNIMFLLYFWLSLPFSVTALLRGCGLLPFAPSFASHPALYGLLRLQDATLFTNIVDGVLQASSLPRDRALVVMRRSRYHLVANRPPENDDEASLVATGRQLICDIISELQGATMRFQGPLPFLWDVVVDAVDPMAGASRSDGRTLTLNEREAIASLKRSLPPGVLPSPIALDNAAPSRPMRAIVREFRSVSV